MNLKSNDLVNFQMARAADAACILVGDIDRGGVFAQIIGSCHLMTPKERRMTAGFIINKFRGDPELFASGMAYIVKKTGKPVLGLIPFFQDIRIDPEDSVSIQEDQRTLRAIGAKTVNIGVVRLPAISNFTDFEALALEKDVVVNYLFRCGELAEGYDCLILPGTKNVMEDALWLARSGWKKRIQTFAKTGKPLLGICGGYQLLGERIMDPSSVESTKKSVKGLHLLPLTTSLETEKVVRKVIGTCLMNGKRVRGYEIHMGKSHVSGSIGEPFLRIHPPGRNQPWLDGWCVDRGKIAGTYLHGIFDSPGFRADYLNRLRRAKGLKQRAPRQGRNTRFHQYDRLADHFEKNCDLETVFSLIS
jgi:adenosylcobyric acid synthase